MTARIGLHHLPSPLREKKLRLGDVKGMFAKLRDQSDQAFCTQSKTRPGGRLNGKSRFALVDLIQARCYVALHHEHQNANTWGASSVS